VLAAAAAVTAAWGTAAAAAEGLTQADMKTLAEIAAAAERGDCAKVVKRSEPLVERRGDVLPGQLAAALYDGIAGCALAARDTEKAYAAALRGTAIPESSPELWYIRLGAEQRMKRYGAAAATIEAMADGHGAALNAIPLPELWNLLDDMKSAGAAEARMRALKLLASDRFAPAELFGSNDNFRYVYAQALLSAGDSVSAEPLIHALETPEIVAAASLDPRMRASLASTDVRAAAETTLARHRLWLAREPDRLRPLIAVATNLRQLGRAGEALDLLKTAEPRLGKLTAGEDADQVNWWWNEVAQTQEALARADETVAAYAMGMKASEGGAPNVSQLINLALAQIRFGRPKDALATLAVRELSAGGASPYGTMLYRHARACALHLLGRGGEAAADVDYVRSHEKDAPGAVTQLFLCLGDMDAAAASAVRRLDDPDLRADMLLQLSDFDLAPPPLATDKAAQNLEALKKRADVQAAVARAGGTRRFNVAEI
jgi:hypothetical protein